MSIEDYHAHPAISKSGLKTLVTKTPAHYWAEYRKAPDVVKKISREKIFGQAFHTFLLEPQEFKKRYAPNPGLNKNTKAYKEIAARVASFGGELLDHDELQSLVSMRQAVLRHPVAGKHLRHPPRGRIKKKSLIETSIFFTDAETGVRCKIRPDEYLIDDKIILDPKTTADASPEAFAKSVYAYGYDIQRALYMKGVEQAMKVVVKDMLFIAVEKIEPYAVGVYRLDASYCDIGYQRMRAGLEIFAKCDKEKSWPALPPVVQDISPPAYLQGRYEIKWKKETKDEPQNSI